MPNRIDEDFAADTADRAAVFSALNRIEALRAAFEELTVVVGQNQGLANPFKEKIELMSEKLRQAFRDSARVGPGDPDRTPQE